MQLKLYLLVFIVLGLFSSVDTKAHPVKFNSVSLRQRSDDKLAINNSPPCRQMVPAKSRRSLNSRTDNLNAFLKHDHVLHFIEDEPPRFGGVDHVSKTQFAAHLGLSSLLPSMLLEDVDAHVSYVLCQDGAIEIGFHDIDYALGTREKIHTYDEMLIITSHFGCNDERERRPFVVTGAKRWGQSLTMTVAATSWQESFHSMDVSFGSQSREPYFARHNQHSKRQAAGASKTMLSNAIPSTTFSAVPTQSQAESAGLNLSWIDTQILPPRFPDTDSTSLSTNVSAPPGVTLSCKNCTLAGNAAITHGLITSNGLIDSSNTSENVIEFFTEGYIELAASFTAYIELESTFISPPSNSSNDTGTSFTAPLPDVVLLGFKIPFLAEVGLVFRPQITLGMSGAEKLDFTYGFELDIPSNSSIVLDISDPSRSNITGFQQTSLNALPFQADFDAPNVTVHAAFEPQLLVTMGILENSVEVGAGAFLDLPKLSAQIAKVEHVDQECNPISGAAVKKGNVFDSLTHIVPSVEVGIGVFVKAEVDFLDIDINANDTIWNFTTTLPTACVSFDATKASYIPATAAAAIKAKGEKSVAAAIAGRKLEGWFTIGRSLWIGILMGFYVFFLV